MSQEVFVCFKTKWFAFPVTIGMDNRYRIIRGTVILHHTMLVAKLSKRK